jgi:hypothetical protein
VRSLAKGPVLVLSKRHPAKAGPSPSGCSSNPAAGAGAGAGAVEGEAAGSSDPFAADHEEMYDIRIKRLDAISAEGRGPTPNKDSGSSDRSCASAALTAKGRSNSDDNYVSELAVANQKYQARAGATTFRVDHQAHYSPLSEINSFLPSKCCENHPIPDSPLNYILIYTFLHVDSN